MGKLHWIMVILRLVGLVVLVMPAHAHSARQSNEKIDCNNNLGSLSPVQREFFERDFARATKKKFSQKDMFAQLQICSGDCVEFMDFASGRKYRVIWDETVRFPTLGSSETERTLQIPKEFDWTQIAPRERDGIIKSWLVGSKFHPQIEIQSATTQSRRILRSVQQDGKEAVLSAMRDGESSFLYVSPTGTGKTEILLHVLREALQHRPKPLSVVIADANILVDQLADNIAGLQKKSLRQKALNFEIQKWGNGVPGDLAKLLADINSRRAEGGSPLILVTTIQSLKSALSAVKDDAQRTLLQGLTDVLNTLAYDEAHHVGAAQTQALLKLLRSRPNADFFLYGTTATPVHSQASISSLFNHRVFWSYLDTAASYRKGERRDPSLSAIVDQLVAAAKLGDLTPIRNFSFIDPDLVRQQTGESFFTSMADLGDETSTRYVVSPKLYDTIISNLEPALRRHTSGFISLSTIAEAKAFAKRLNQKFSQGDHPIRFAALYSGMPAAEAKDIRERLKTGEISYAVTVRQLDEGADFPKMSLYIDLNHSITPRQFLQRAGRIQRLFFGKEDVEIISALLMNEAYLRDTIELLEAVINNPNFVQGPKARGTPSAGITGFLVGDQVSLVQIQSKLKDFWQKSLKFSPEATAAELSDFIKSNGRLPTTNRSWESGLYRRLIYCFYHAREDFFDNLSEEGKVLVVQWIRKRLPTVGFRSRRSGFKRIAELVNSYFEIVGWLETLPYDLDLADLVNPDKSNDINMRIYFEGLPFYDEFFEILESRAYDYAFAAIQNEFRRLEPDFRKIYDLGVKLKKSLAVKGARAFTNLTPEEQALLLRMDGRDQIYYVISPPERPLLEAWVKREREKALVTLTLGRVDKSTIYRYLSLVMWIKQRQTLVRLPPLGIADLDEKAIELIVNAVNSQKTFAVWFSHDFKALCQELVNGGLVRLE